MLKKVIRYSVFLLITLGTFIGFSKNADAARRKFLRLKYVGKYPYVRLYINGSSRGKLRRNQRRSFYLRTRKRYRIRTEFGGKVSRTSVYLPSFKNKTKLIFAPTRRGSIRDDRSSDRDRKRYRYIILRYRGRKPYVRIYINGRRYGKLRRYSVRRIRKRAGRRYTIKAKYALRTSTKRVFLSRYRNKSVTFYAPYRR